jgi:hypothetical protein
VYKCNAARGEQKILDREYEFELRAVLRLVNRYPGKTANELVKIIGSLSFDLRNSTNLLFLKPYCLLWKLRYLELCGDIYSTKHWGGYVAWFPTIPEKIDYRQKL